MNHPSTTLYHQTRCLTPKLEKHPDKMYIGKIEKGFDFLGYHFSPEGLSVALKTVEQFVARAGRGGDTKARGDDRVPYYHAFRDVALQDLTPDR